MENSQDLENLLLPSRWSKRLPPDTIVDKHVEFIYAESLKAKQAIPCDLNIPYGLLEKEKIDIFGTDLPKSAPIFAFVHGGYWQEVALKRDSYHFIAAPLYKNGIKSIFIGYELCPSVSLKTIIEEIEEATKACINYAKENNAKLFLAGYSAGAQLVASLFTKIAQNFSDNERKLIDTVFLIAGVYDLRQIPKTSINDPLKLNDDEAYSLSPILHSFSNVTPKIFVIYAENDSPEFKKQSLDLCEKLKQVQAKSVLVPDVDHFNVVELFSDLNYDLTKIILDSILL